VERAVVVGNCQALGLQTMLGANAAFAERFAFVSFPAVHEIPDEDVPRLHAAVAEASVVLLQRIDDGYRDGIGLGTETLAGIASDAATVIRWPSVFWAGYTPDLFYLRDAGGRPVTDGPFDYHDRAILRAFVDGRDVAQTCALLADPDRPTDAAAHAARATAELETRGAGSDVDVTMFIQARFQEELLFFSMNHPSNRLLSFLADQATDLLGLPGTSDLRKIPNQMLDSTFYPLHANHVRALGLTFGATVEAGRIPFRVRGTEYEAGDAVRMFFDYYRGLDHGLVEANAASTARA
jgi:hypothetical protein